MPASRKSWIWTANFWNKPWIGSFIQKISSCSNGCCYPFKNNLHPFERLTLSVWKKSFVWTAEVICSKKYSFVWTAEFIHPKKAIRLNGWGYPFGKNHHQQQDPAQLAAEPFMSTCSLWTLFFGHMNARNHVPNVSLAVQTPGVTHLKLFFSCSNGWQLTSVQIFLSAIYM